MTIFYTLGMGTLALAFFSQALKIKEEIAEKSQTTFQKTNKRIDFAIMFMLGVGFTCLWGITIITLWTTPTP